MSAEGSSADRVMQEFVDLAIPFPEGQVLPPARHAKMSDEQGVLDRSVVVEGDKAPQALVVEDCSTPELVRLVEEFGGRLSLGDLFRIHDVAAGRLRTSDAMDAERLQQLLRQLLEETALRARTP